MRSAPRPLLPSAFALLLAAALAARSGDDQADRFAQLDELLPTPNVYRAASGAPGHAYWQQRADYDVRATLDEDERRITGSERIAYHNHSPDALSYLWLEVAPNLFSPESHARLSDSEDFRGASYQTVSRMLAREGFDGGAEILRVEDEGGEPLPHVVVDTMMRVDLPEPLEPGGTFAFEVDWTYRINDASKIGGRTGFEPFDDGSAIFCIAQWFPRMCAYTDATGWQNKPYLGRGEFTLEFGDYRVALTVPDDHVVAATGTLVNPDEVLAPEQRERLARARESDRPVFVVTMDEARANLETAAEGTRTWVFEAEDVRDFAWASSRRFLWDAMGVEVEGRRVLAMSAYPPEAEPLWSRYSTHAVAHTLEVYGRACFPYPYPVAWSVNGPVGGMEYPMLSFNGPRPEEDGTYSARTKHGLISVVIHEVGHNWFPMVVNSDERQWTWMDEGLNTFVQGLAEAAWSEDYPSRRGEPRQIAEYMASERQVPIMTNSESVVQFGNNAYAKPAAALTVLRETVMGRELFDFAFREYATRWRFKRPMPADFFRTLEDASSVDLDWFFRGWFFTTGHVDLALDGVRAYRIDTRDPDVEKPLARARRDAEPESLSALRNAILPKRVETFPELADFYDGYDELDVTERDREAFTRLLEGLDDEERAALALDATFYVVDVRNEGGLPMPVILELAYEDGSVEELRLPAEIWKEGQEVVSRVVRSERTLARVVLDPRLETADADLSDNRFPPALEVETVELRSGGRGDRSNPMRDAREAERGRPVEAGAPPAAEGGAEPAAAPAKPEDGAQPAAEGAAEPGSDAAEPDSAPGGG